MNMGRPTAGTFFDAFKVLNHNVVWVGVSTTIKVVLFKALSPASSTKAPSRLRMLHSSIMAVTVIPT